jgi:hypothetical protein
MGYRIRLAPEVEKWAAELNARVLSAWHSSPASTPCWLLGKIGFWVAVSGMDAAYQGHLAALTRVRRAVADVATWRKRLELQIGELERQADELRDPSRSATDARQGGTADQQ